MPALPGETPGTLSRRRFIADAVIVLGGGALLGVGSLLLDDRGLPSEPSSPSAPSLPESISIPDATPLSTSTTVPIDPSPTSEVEILPVPEFPDLTKFETGEFLGTATIRYVDTPERPATEIDAYYERKGLAKPPMNNPFVHQLIAGGAEGSDAITDEMLAHGVVAHKINGAVTILAMHNVTPVDAPVAIDGTTHNQTQMGINAVVVPGDVLTLVLPDQSGLLASFSYKAVRSWIIDTHDATASEAILHDSEPFGTQKVRTYKCWEPGDDRYRLVDEWVWISAEVSTAEIAQGNDGDVGSVGPNL